LLVAAALAFAMVAATVAAASSAAAITSIDDGGMNGEGGRTKTESEKNTHVK
jgi:Spy/CpxP family protein refolding chaperone